MQGLQFADAKRALANHYHTLLCKGGVQAVYIGIKSTGGKQVNAYAVVCGVEKKLPLSKVKAQDLIPSSLGTVVTDVVETGKLEAIATTDKHRPAPGGVSIGHFRITAGTLGCLVTDNTNGEKFILSNNHVLANSNGASIGDSILQPGPHDGGLSTDRIGTLHAFVPIDFGSGGGGGSCPIGDLFVTAGNFVSRLLGRKTRVQVAQPQEAVNFVDCAIARVTEAADVIPDILGIGVPTGSSQAFLGQAVKKSGRTTGLTTGVITGVDAIVQVNYGGGNVALFHDQLIMGPMSAGGDSGSAILNDDNEVVALLYAGSDSTTIGSPIHYALDAFNVSI